MLLFSYADFLAWRGKEAIDVYIYRPIHHTAVDKE